VLLDLSSLSACSFAAGATFGQTAPSNLAFDVATVKPSPPLDMAKLAAEVQAGKMPKLGPHVSASQAEYTYVSLKDLDRHRVRGEGFQITGPAWLATERFDIVAKMPTSIQR